LLVTRQARRIDNAAGDAISSAGGMGAQRHRIGALRLSRLWRLAIAGMLVGSGCSYVEPVDEQTIREAFPFIRDGETTKKEVLHRFGTPDSEHEDGRIMTYRAGCAGYARLALVEPPCSLATYRLVLVFGPDAVLERHSAVLQR